MESESESQKRDEDSDRPAKAFLHSQDQMAGGFHSLIVKEPVGRGLISEKNGNREDQEQGEQLGGLLWGLERVPAGKICSNRRQ